MKHIAQYKEIIRIALPAIFENLAMVLSTYIGMKMGSRLGMEDISVVSISTQPKQVFNTIFVALGIATSVFVAQAYGKKDVTEANKYFFSILKVTILIALLFGILSYIFAEPIMLFYNHQDETLDKTIQYFSILMGFIVFNAISIIINAAFRGIGKTNITFITNFAMVIVTILFTYILIDGKFGFPRLEVYGNAVASIIGAFVACIFGFIFLLKHSDFFKIKDFLLHKIFQDRNILLNVKSKAGNLVFENLAVRFGFFLNGMIITTLPTYETSIYFVAMILMGVSFAVGDGVQSAVIALIGRSFGQKNIENISKYFYLALRIGFILSLILSLTYIASANAFFSSFFQGESTINTGKTTVIFVSIISYLQIIRIICIALMRGTGDVKTPRRIASYCVLIVNPLLSCIFVLVFYMGIWGIWCATLLTHTAWLICSFWKAKSRLNIILKMNFD